MRFCILLSNIYPEINKVTAKTWFDLCYFIMLFFLNFIKIFLFLNSLLFFFFFFSAYLVFHDNIVRMSEDFNKCNFF